MVVAGRVTETGDVAIMMVEAEATEQTWQLVQDGAQAPSEEIVAGGLDAAKPFIKQLCEAQAELAKQAAKPVADFPVFLDYEDDVYAAVEAGRRGRHRCCADHRGQAGARGAARRHQGRAAREGRPQTSRVARRRSAPRSGR